MKTREATSQPVVAPCSSSLLFFHTFNSFFQSREASCHSLFRSISSDMGSFRAFFPFIMRNTNTIRGPGQLYRLSPPPGEHFPGSPICILSHKQVRCTRGPTPASSHFLCPSLHWRLLCLPASCPPILMGTSTHTLREAFSGHSAALSPPLFSVISN